MHPILEDIAIGSVSANDTVLIKVKAEITSIVKKISSRASLSRVIIVSVFYLDEVNVYMSPPFTSPTLLKCRISLTKILQKNKIYTS